MLPVAAWSTWATVVTFKLDSGGKMTSSASHTSFCASHTLRRGGGVAGWTLALQTLNPELCLLTGKYDPSRAVDMHIREARGGVRQSWTHWVVSDRRTLSQPQTVTDTVSAVWTVSVRDEPGVHSSHSTNQSGTLYILFYSTLFHFTLLFLCTEIFA